MEFVMANEKLFVIPPLRGAGGCRGIAKFSVDDLDCVDRTEEHPPSPPQGGNFECVLQFKHTLDKVTFLLVALSAFFISFPSFAFAWGQIGHRVVGMIAAQHLTPKAQQEIAKLLQPGETLASISTYADEIRNSRPDTRRLHYVNIPLLASEYMPSRDCRSSDEGDCIIAGLERFRLELANVKETRERRAFALKFIVHLIGDLHQPLHCGDNNDRGGNDVKVTWFGPNERQQNLHGIWDYAIIEQGGRKEEDWFKILSNAAPENIPALQAGNVTQWAMESWRAAKEHAYKIPPNRQFGKAYYDKSLPVVEDRLRKAGLRLARVLNEALQ
jgi:hypothetical protein